MGRVAANPAILKWARETSNWPVEVIAKKMGQDVTVIECWESGAGSPTYVQLERLAHELYHRPVALFFFPEPPSEQDPREQFRTLPELEYRSLSPRLVHLVRKAQTMLINLQELADGVNSSQKNILKSVPNPESLSLAESTQTIRQCLGIDLAEQAKWKSTKVAVEQWREALEDCGVFVFKEAFDDDGVSGFCLYDSEFPIIYVNNSLAEARQVFTLFHELAHLLYRTGGIDRVRDTHLMDLKNHDRRVEVFCNAFAGHFLVPDCDLDRRVPPHVKPEIAARELAAYYSVSPEVIMRRFLDRGEATQEEYESLVEAWAPDAKRPVRDDGGHGNYYNTQVAYLGNRYLDLAFGKYYRHQISVYDLSGYLGVKVDNIPRLEAAWIR